MYITKHYDATFDMKRERMFVGCACVPQTFDEAFRTKLGSSPNTAKIGGALNKLFRPAVQEHGISRLHARNLLRHML